MKQHFVPQFLLRRWTGGSGQLYRYTQPFQTKVHQRQVYPSECGFAENLYNEVAGESWFETETLQIIDNTASDVLLKLIAQEEISSTEKENFGVFVRSALHRSPHMMRAFEVRIRGQKVDLHSKFRQQASSGKRPESLAAIDLAFADTSNDRGIHLLPGLLTTEKITGWLNAAKWMVFKRPEGAHRLLISDDYVFRSRGLARKGGYLMMPLSPEHLLLMTTCEQTIFAAAQASTKDLVKDMNLVVVEGAREFVAASNLAQDRFIRNHYGKSPRQPLLG